MGLTRADERRERREERRKEVSASSFGAGPDLGSDEPEPLAGT
jgi:hypothetical protein